MAFANTKKCYSQIIIYLLLISVYCASCHVCRNTVYEVFSKQTPKNYCSIDEDKFTHNQQILSDGVPSTKGHNENKNVLDTLKVILNKVKIEVKSDIKETSRSKLQKDSINHTSEILSKISKNQTELADDLKLKRKSGDREALLSQNSISPSDEQITQNEKESKLENLNETEQTTKLEEAVNDNDTLKVDQIVKNESDTKVPKHKSSTEEIRDGLENTPQRGTLVDVSDISTLENLNVIHNTSHEQQEPSKDEESLDPHSPVNEDVEVAKEKENSSVLVELPPVVEIESNLSDAKNIEEDPEAVVPAVDVNASLVPEEEISDEAPKEKDQLETYNQFAERVLAEKKNGAGGSNGHSSNGQGGTKGPKVKSKNYASTDCGAKFMAANPEASHSHKIINSNKDEYMLNKCTEKIWVTVELCESIRPQKFDIANFELFSNLPKEIQLYGSHRYPTRDWASLGTFIGEEGNREAQSFHIETQEFFKFIKLEIHSHYGTEFYCPLSLFRIYGLSEFEIIEEEEQVIEEEEEEGREEKDATPQVEKAKNGIMIPDVLKAMFNGVLEVIKRGSRSGNSTDLPELNTYNQTCKSLKENFTVKNESCNYADLLNYILACYYDEYLKLLTNPFLAEVVQNTYFCQHLAHIICTSPQNNDSYVYDSVCNNSYACVMLSPKHILAMCYMNDPTLLNAFGCEPVESEVSEQLQNFSTKSNIDDLPLDIPVDIPERKFGKNKVSNGSLKTQTVDKTSPEAELKNVETLHDNLEEEISSPDSSQQRLPEEVADDGSTDSHEQQINASSVVPDNISDKTEKTEKSTDKKKERKQEKVSTEKHKDSEDSQPQESKGTTATTITTPPPTTAIPSTSSENRVASSHSNKESLIVRLSNKIKGLEHNMSISSQYLEELSRRYKRQMEDMEVQFNSTILALNQTSQIAFERDLYHQTRIESLENLVEKLYLEVSSLKEEKDSLLMTAIEQHMILLFIEVLVISLVLHFCLKRLRSDGRRVPPSQVETPTRTDSKREDSSGCSVESDQHGRDTPLHFRRRSVDTIKTENEVKPKERRFSGQTAALGSYKDLLLTEGAAKEKKKKKKKSQLQRSLSNASIHDVKKRSSSVSSKKERKLEKLKKSCAGVLFSGENTKDSKSSSTNFQSSCGIEDSKQDDWHVVKRSKNKKNKGELGTTQFTDDQTYPLSSDLKRGKILVEERLCDVYQDPYYSEVIYDSEYNMYPKSYLDSDYKDLVHYDYPQDVVCDPINQVYLPDFDCTTPVIDYYHTMTGISYNSRIIEEQDRSDHEEPVTSLWDSEKGSRSMKTVKNPVVPSSLKGKTRLRSDNWEWYSSQPSRLNSKLSNSAEKISTSSSSDSSSLAKKIPSDIRLETLKWEKKKKKKKGIKLMNGDH